MRRTVILFIAFFLLSQNSTLNSQNSRRPAPEKRLFRSAAIDSVIESMRERLIVRSPKLWWMFEACFPNTLDTTVDYDEESGDTFIATGDIHAMWLRDSGAQVWPYLPYMHADPRLQRMIRGLIRRQLRYICLDPYANAFNKGATGSEWATDYTLMRPELHERKYEIDSLCYPLRLAYQYWLLTGDDSIFDDQWLAAMKAILQVFREQQRKGGNRTSYTFARRTTSLHDTTSNYGYGHPARPVGLIASFFRPSDDSCVFPFLVPANFFAVSVLRKAATILRRVNHDEAMAAECTALAQEVETALKKYAVVDTPEWGRVYAYEVDGYGSHLLMDDANVPSLLSLPYIADVPLSDPVYQNTRRMIWSPANPYFFTRGIGSPHTGLDNVWPMSLIMKALTTTDPAERDTCLATLLATDGDTGFMHESYNKDDPKQYTRAWFAWANTLFGELVLTGGAGFQPAAARAPRRLKACPPSYAGLMIDVSRHFFPLSFLRQQIDHMQRAGLNHLHLHLTDAAGWRMEIRSYPRLTEVGAWRTEREWKTWWAGERKYGGPYGGYYTQDELRALVAYARERGVEIIPEIEFPAHSEEVIAAYPELGYNHAELDMANPKVYAFMETVLREVADVFPSEYIHIGGDEAGTQRERQPEAMRRVADIVQRLGRKAIVWDEALTDDPADSSMVIMVWRNAATAQRAIALGHDVIMSPGAYCYLDKYQDAPEHEPEAMGGYLPYEDMRDSIAKSKLNIQNSKLLGYQANLWTEYISTPEHAEYMLWPRAAAVADSTTERDTRPRVGQRPEYAKPYHGLSVGKPVRYLAPYYEGYAAGGASALTDGLRGGWSNTDGRWQGFITRDRLDVVIDLQRVEKLHRISAAFMQQTGPEIFLPERVIITVSQDGERYDTLYNAEYNDDPAPARYTRREWTGKARARYVRYQALAGRRGGWVFTDEIEVE